MQKGFVIQISGNVFLSFPRLNLPLKSHLSIWNTGYLMTLKMVSVLLRLDTVQSVSCTSQLRKNNLSFRTTDSASCLSYRATVKQI
jgi:hypothetical protein